MPGKLAELDQQLFLYLNHLGCDGLDPVMRFLSGPVPWILLTLLILLVTAQRSNWKFNDKSFWIILTAFAIASLISEQSSVHLFKNVFERLRPCHEPALAEQVRLAASHCGGAFGFVSTHASNSFTLAILILLIFKRNWLSISVFVWATLISYSRIYVGVHYPGDVLGGMLLGCAIAVVVYLVYQQMEGKKNNTKAVNSQG